jgi:4'-phosphopantetheinyl transferase
LDIRRGSKRPEDAEGGEKIPSAAGGVGKFGLASDEVQSWCVRLNVPPETSARLYATLTDDERNRSARFRFERDRQRFIVARGVLRELLGRYLRTDPGQIRFVYNAFGKPLLSPAFGNRLKFNLSHSADLALIAIAAHTNVGIDVEYIRAQSDYADIARQFFSAAEVDHLNGLPSHLRPQAFFSCWTKKEAYLKADGEGLAGDLDGASIDAAAQRWSLYTLQPAPGYVGALAIDGGGWRLGQWHWGG